MSTKKLYEKTANFGCKKKMSLFGQVSLKRRNFTTLVIFGKLLEFADHRVIL